MSGLGWSFGRYTSDKSTRNRRPRLFKASVEVVEDRTLLSTLSAISWSSGGLQHSAVFAIGSNDSVYMNTDATGKVALGGYAKQISAGLDAAGNPEVFAIGSDNALYVNHANGAGWASLGGYVKEIGATTHNTVFAIGSNDSVYVNSGAGTSRWGATPSRSAPGWTPPAIQRSSPSGPTMPCTSTTPTGPAGPAGRLRQGDQRHDAQHRLRHRQQRQRLRQQRGGQRLAGGLCQADQRRAGLRRQSRGLRHRSNNALHVNHANGAGWVSLGGYVREIGLHRPPPSACPEMWPTSSASITRAIFYRSSFISLGGLYPASLGSGHPERDQLVERRPAA